MVKIHTNPELKKADDIQILGDFNIDLLQHQIHNHTMTYLDTLLSYKQLPLITLVGFFNFSKKLKNPTNHNIKLFKSYNDLYNKSIRAAKNIIMIVNSMSFQKTWGKLG